MFLGHFGLGLAGKRAAPGVSLGTLFLATQWADLLFFPLALVGLERFRLRPGATLVTPLEFPDYPISHSLLGLVVWGVLLGGLDLLFRRIGRRPRPGPRRRQPLVPGRAHAPAGHARPAARPVSGLRLWNSVLLTLAAEAIVFGLGIAVYLRTTRAVDRTGTWALWSLLVFLALIWIGSVFGPPPSDERAVEYSGLALWLFVPWGWWIDRHRAIVGGHGEARR